MLERENRHPPAAMMRIGQRGIDRNDEPWSAALAKRFGNLRPIGFQPSGELRGGRRPAAGENGELARQDRVFEQESHETARQHFADEVGIPGARGRCVPERVEQGELGKDRCVPQQVGFEGGSRLRPEELLEVDLPPRRPRSPQHRHQQVEERRRIAAGEQEALRERALGALVGDLAGGGRNRVDPLQPVGFENGRGRSRQRPRHVRERQIVPGQATLERLGIAGRERVNPGSEDRERLVARHEPLGSRSAVGRHREGRALEHARRAESQLTALIARKVPDVALGHDAPGTCS